MTWSNAKWRESCTNEKSCGAVVYNKNNSTLYYLLLRYEAGHWDFVKGNVEKGETEQETVIRELREETGITEAHFIDGFKQRIAYFYKRQGLTIQKEVMFYLMETKQTDVKISFEHIGFEWLSYLEAMERLTFKNAKETLRKANDFLSAKLPA